MTKEFTGKLEKIDSCRWRIPKSYMPGMKVDGVIYADEKMIKSIVRDNAPQQVANAAFLPGIVKASMAMPDIHWGYGLPIGGVVATDIEEGGVITPGGVGYDINCLSGDSKILMNTGAYLEIRDFEKIFGQTVLSCMDLTNNRKDETTVRNFIKLRPKNKVFEVLTRSGNSMIATEDHPFWTPDGMLALRDIGLGDNVAVYPFEGLPFEEPSSQVILDEQDIVCFLNSIGKGTRGNAVNQIMVQLKKRKLLPLCYNSPQLPVLLKIMGYNAGDGNIYFAGKNGKGTTSFYGSREDLEGIRADIEKTGFGCSRVYSRTREHKITTRYSTRTFTSENFTCKVSSSAFAALIAALGTPVGNKTRQGFGVPDWIKRSPFWQKRLFLAAFFGAEMSSPKTMGGGGYNFYCPAISLNKRPGYVRSGKEFLSDIAGMLEELGVRTHGISERKEQKNKDGETSIRLRLLVSNKTEDLISLYSKIGFEYNRERTILANAAIQYLKFKKILVDKRLKLEAEAVELASAGVSAGSIHKELDSEGMNTRFIERSIYGGRRTSPRVGQGTITFEEFLEYSMRGIETSGMLWDRIESVKEIDFHGEVYDFTVEHGDHNFIANNFVVSNCGVRLLKTRLTDADILPCMKELVDAIYAKVPSGVGSTGDIRADLKEERNILIKGARWAVEKGYGWQSDLDNCEENGAIEGADPSSVSERALQRGRKQPGTLGSGNHFLEVQVVDEIYRPDIAEGFGIEKGQITVMIHTGSRGLGHQVCGDYAQGMVRLLQKFHINVPDRQLACVPVDSPEGQDYLGAMRSAANYAWANRQTITFLVRKAFERVFSESAEALGMHLVYDVAHNIAKIEEYEIGGKKRRLCVHRKGATRAFPPGHPELPERYRKTGQPVIIPGDMGRCSYLLAGTEGAVESFYSTCHGAGRLLSRAAAVKATRGRSIVRELAAKGVTVRYTGRDTLNEEVPEAYKNVTDVVDIVEGAGISVKVARMRPLGVVKG